MGLSVVIRTAGKSQLLALVLTIVGLTTVAFYFVARMPSGFGNAVQGGGTEVQRGRDLTPEEQSELPIHLNVTVAEPAVQLEWDPSGSSELSGAELTRFLKIEWTVEETLVRDSLSATLDIRDGTSTVRFPIEPERLARGSRTYLPKSVDVRLELRVLTSEGSDQIAIAHFVSAEALSIPSQQGGANPQSVELSGRPPQQSSRSTESLPTPGILSVPPVKAQEVLETPKPVEMTVPANQEIEPKSLTEKGPSAPPFGGDDPPSE